MPSAIPSQKLEAPPPEAPKKKCLGQRRSPVLGALRPWQPVGMPVDQWERAGTRYALQYTYAVPDDAWYVELSEAVPAPTSWADIPNAATYLPGSAFLTAVVPDEDAAREPTICLHPASERTVPYEVMRWFMEKVTEEVERCRAALDRHSQDDA